MKFLIAIILLLLQSDSFSQFSYCVQRRQGPFESQCVELNPAGKGRASLKRRTGDEVKVDVSLSADARDRFLALLAATNNLDEAETYESPRKVADLGAKHLTIELPSGKREAEFNFSTRKEVQDLVNFCDGVINGENLAIEIDTALRFDRLSIPKKIEQIESGLKSSRYADPERLVPILDKILSDQRIMNFARNHAGKMKEQILAKKVK